MKSITIHGIDRELDQKISQKSKELGLSQNRTVKTILQESLSAKRQEQNRRVFSDLFGKWSPEERREFETRIQELDEIHPSDWDD